MSVAGLGGTIEISSEVGVGSTFSVRLPLSPPQAVAIAASAPLALPPASLPVPSSAYSSTFIRDIENWQLNVRTGIMSSSASTPLAFQPLDRSTVLVTDDNADMRSFVSGILSPYYNVVEAADGQVRCHYHRETSETDQPRRSGSILYGHTTRSHHL